MLLKFVGNNTEGTTYESEDVKTREDIKKVDEMVQSLINSEEFYGKPEEEIVLDAFSRCGFTAKQVKVISILM